MLHQKVSLRDILQFEACNTIVINYIYIPVKLIIGYLFEVLATICLKIIVSYIHI